jgi:sulfide:quinone oxidoreductase
MEAGPRAAPAGVRPTDRVVTLPRLEGPRLAGVLHDANGFIPTDDRGQVMDEIDVWAAGRRDHRSAQAGRDCNSAGGCGSGGERGARGAALEPSPFRPVLRGLLLTGMAPHFLRAQAGARTSVIDTEPLWWPPAKIVGRYLAPFLAGHLGLSQILPDPGRDSALPVEVELSPAAHGAWSQP